MCLTYLIHHNFSFCSLFFFNHDLFGFPNRNLDKNNLSFSSSLPRWYTLTINQGSLTTSIQQIYAGGLPAARAMWPSPSPRAWCIIAGFGLLEAVLQLVVPGKTFHGPVTPKGNVPVYKVVGVVVGVVGVVGLGLRVGGWVVEYANTPYNISIPHTTSQYPIQHSIPHTPCNTPYTGQWCAALPRHTAAPQCRVCPGPPRPWCCI